MQLTEYEAYKLYKKYKHKYKSMQYQMDSYGGSPDELVESPPKSGKYLYKVGSNQFDPCEIQKDQKAAQQNTMIQSIYNPGKQGAKKANKKIKAGLNSACKAVQDKETGAAKLAVDQDEFAKASFIPKPHEYGPPTKGYVMTVSANGNPITDDVKDICRTHKFFDPCSVNIKFNYKQKKQEFGEAFKKIYGKTDKQIKAGLEQDCKAMKAFERKKKIDNESAAAAAAAFGASPAGKAKTERWNKMKKCENECSKKCKGYLNE
jgi:hypothetical protein